MREGRARWEEYSVAGGTYWDKMLYILKRRVGFFPDGLDRAGSGAIFRVPAKTLLEKRTAFLFVDRSPVELLGYG